MTATRNTALDLGMAAIVALTLLQLVWYGWLFLPAHGQVGPTLVMTMAPLLFSLWMCLRQGSRRGVLIAGIFCLAYFSHGVSSAWSSPPSRALALIETALSLAVIAALGWDARHYRRRA